LAGARFLFAAFDAATASGVHGPADGVADDLARPGIKDGSEVDEAAGDGDIGSGGIGRLRRWCGSYFEPRCKGRPSL
jgi:hypothetical protein